MRTRTQARTAMIMVRTMRRRQRVAAILADLWLGFARALSACDRGELSCRQNKSLQDIWEETKPKFPCLV